MIGGGVMSGSECDVLELENGRKPFESPLRDIDGRRLMQDGKEVERTFQDDS